MFYSTDEDCYLTYPDGDVADRNAIEEMVEDMNSRIQQLLNENEKLKKELEEVNKKLYLCTPELPQNVHGSYISYVDLINEIYKLRKQLTQYHLDVDKLHKIDNPFDNLKYKNTKVMTKEKEELKRGKWIEEFREQIEDKLIKNVDDAETLGAILNYLDSLYISIDNQLCKIKECKAQQQEFMKYLESEINEKEEIQNSRHDLVTANIHGWYNITAIELETLEKISQKYKEMIQK